MCKTESADSRDHFTARARLQAMLDVEAALARAEARAGVIPLQRPQRSDRQRQAELFDVDAIEAESVRAGNLAIPLVGS